MHNEVLKLQKDIVIQNIVNLWKIKDIWETILKVVVFLKKIFRYILRDSILMTYQDLQKTLSDNFILAFFSLLVISDSL